MTKTQLLRLLENLPIRDDEPVYITVDTNRPKTWAMVPLRSVEHDHEIGVVLRGTDDPPKGMSEEDEDARMVHCIEDIPRVGGALGS